MQSANRACVSHVCDFDTVHREQNLLIKIESCRYRRAEQGRESAIFTCIFPLIREIDGDGFAVDCARRHLVPSQSRVSAGQGGTCKNSAR